MRVNIDYRGIHAEFETERTLFSPTAPDRGTMAMLSIADFQPGMRVLDLGCGWGPVGVLAARICGEENVTMCDVSPVAAEMSRRNAAANGVGNVKVCVSDGLNGVDEAGFDLILSNPPYQSDFAVAKHFIEKGFNRLKIGGKMLMVTKRREWYKNRIIAIFGGVHVHEIDGYFVFEAEKRQASYGNKRK